LRTFSGGASKARLWVCDGTDGFFGRAEQDGAVGREEAVGDQTGDVVGVAELAVTSVSRSRRRMKNQNQNGPVTSTTTPSGTPPRRTAGRATK
jgi:hypothetical protein